MYRISDEFMNKYVINGGFFLGVLFWFLFTG